MNVRQIVVSLFAVSAVFSVNEIKAQNEIYSEEEIMIVDFVPSGKTYYYSPSFRDNWFMSVGAGTQTLLAEHKGRLQFSLALAVDFGKWFSPYWGARLAVSGGELRSRYPSENDMVYYKDVVVSADFLWDMTNTVGGYDPYRVVSVIPFIGVSTAYAFKNSFSGKTFSMAGTGGVRLNFRLCRYADLYVEGKAHVVSDSFNGVVHSKRAEAIFSVLGGFAVNFGGTRFKSYNPVEEEFAMDAMNAKVNMLRASLDSCKKVKNKVIVAPAPAPVKEVVVEKLKPCSVELTSVVRFAINSSEITSEEMVNVYNVAQWMKNNPDYKVIVTGYADKDTGTSGYNEKLSRSRADAVVAALVQQYGIPSDRLSVEAEGGSMQPYPDNNNWNRVVVFRSIADGDCSDAAD